MMKLMFIFMLFICANTFAQWKDYKLPHDFGKGWDDDIKTTTPALAGGAREVVTTITGKN